MFGSLGVPELLLIFVVILIVFGPRRIPEIGRTLGKALGEFRKATDDLKSTIEREVRLEELKQITPSVVAPFESVARSEPWESRPVDEAASEQAAEVPSDRVAEENPQDPADPATIGTEQVATAAPEEAPLGDSDPRPLGDSSEREPKAS